MTPQEKNNLCIRIYADIINGFSEFEFDGEKIYIKHLKDLDYAYIENEIISIKAKASEKGLLSEQGKLKILHETDHWSVVEEQTYQNLKTEIANLEKTSSKIFLESQKKVIKQRLGEKKIEFDDLNSQRETHLGLTLEKYLEGKKNEILVCKSLYKDAELKEQMFTYDEFLKLSPDDITSYTTTYYLCLTQFTQNNVKRIAASTFFLNSFMIAKANPKDFFGKAVYDMTIFQNILVSYGCSFKSALEMAEDDMPSYDDIDEIVDWLERQSAIRKNKREQQSTSSTSTAKSTDKDVQAIGIVGATKEEMKTLAKTHDAVEVDLVEQAEKLKKDLGKDKLETRDMVKLHGL